MEIRRPGIFYSQVYFFLRETLHLNATVLEMHSSTCYIRVSKPKIVESKGLS